MSNAQEQYCMPPFSTYLWSATVDASTHFDSNLQGTHASLEFLAYDLGDRQIQQSLSLGNVRVAFILPIHIHRSFWADIDEAIHSECDSAFFHVFTLQCDYPAVEINIPIF